MLCGLATGAGFFCPQYKIKPPKKYLFVERIVLHRLSSAIIVHHKHSQVHSVTSSLTYHSSERDESITSSIFLPKSYFVPLIRPTAIIFILRSRSRHASSHLTRTLSLSTLVIHVVIHHYLEPENSKILVFVNIVSPLATRRF